MRVELAAYDVLFNKLNWNNPDPARRDSWHPAGGVLRDGRHAVIRARAQMTAEAKRLIDGFGAYPYDRTCTVGEHPGDWWLDRSFRPQGQTSIEVVGSLRSADPPDNGRPSQHPCQPMSPCSRYARCKLLDDHRSRRADQTELSAEYHRICRQADVSFCPHTHVHS
jgi:hypothetical protein